jgi:hypothetical protein
MELAVWCRREKLWGNNSVVIKYFKIIICTIEAEEYSLQCAEPDVGNSVVKRRGFVTQ